MTPHAPGPSDGPTDTHTSAREHLATTASIHSTSTQNESIAPSSTPTISTTERHSTTTGIRPASHFQQRNDITGSSITSGSPVSPERLHRSATSPSAASTPSATGSSLTGRASTSCASPDTTATAPKHPATAATAPDVNPVTPTRRRLLPVIIDYVESSRNNAQPTNKSSEVNFICTPPGYKLPPQPKGDGSATSDAQKGK
ncbi:hypothetical protein N7449_005788 [Penicillium cf. viridicatum]|uniref:Uncharacterized protein n=1 Tax=Penicillium cf. viridicatum TaxID=2972119 RepID=A0A9W9MGP0_9EURO|nr:hypothetical protein N7449_005788 [Penicillium cf. viridicatum]